MPEPFLLRYLQPLLAGRRWECFDLVNEALRHGQSAEELVCDVIWPAMSQVERLYRDDRIDTATEHLACRINRTAADQVQPHLPRRPATGRRVLVACAPTESEELGGQLMADLLQADGWEVYFIGGGVPDDEVLQLVGKLRPHLMLIYGAVPETVPATRAVIERIREIGVCSEMNIIVTGGIFGRADGLWREVGADAHCETPRDVIATARNLPPRVANAPRLGVVKKRRRRRKTTAVPA